MKRVLLPSVVAIVAIACAPKAPEPSDPCPEACATLKALACTWAPEATCMPVCHSPGYPASCIKTKTSCEAAARCR